MDLFFFFFLGGGGGGGCHGACGEHALCFARS